MAITDALMKFYTTEVIKNQDILTSAYDFLYNERMLHADSDVVGELNFAGTYDAYRNQRMMKQSTHRFFEIYHHLHCFH